MSARRLSRRHSGLPLLAALSGLLLASVPSAARAEAPRRLSLRQAVQLGLTQSWDVKIASAGVREARIKRGATRMMWFPRLKVTGNLLLWNKDLPFEIPPMDLSSIQMPDGCELFAAYGQCMNAFMQAFDLGKIREQFTMQATVQLVQPLTPLFSIYYANKIDVLGVRMARAKKKRTAQQVRFEITKAYLQVYQAEAFDRIMREAETLVKAHDERVRKLLSEEMVRRAEQLKVRVKLAEVQQGRLRAQAAVELARSNLARVLGLDIEAKLRLTERFPDPPPPFRQSLAACIRRALRKRQEIRMTRLGQRQAEAGRKAKRWMMVPTVAAVAQFEANYGMGTFMPKTAFFVGAVLEWEFEWGKKWRDADVLTAKLNQARLLERKARTGIPLEVKKYYLDLRVARASLRVARAAVKAATESHRIQVKRFELSAASTTDVLDAQMELTRAKASYANALHQYYIAEAALKRAMGGGN